MRAFFCVVMAIYISLFACQVLEAATRQQVKSDLLILDNHLNMVNRSVRQMVFDKKATNDEKQAVLAHLSIMSDLVLSSISLVDGDAPFNEEITQKEKDAIKPKIKRFDEEFVQLQAAVNALRDAEGKKANQDVLAEFKGFMDTIHSEMGMQ